MIRALFSLFRSLHANTHPADLAHAAALALALALLPRSSLLWYLLFAVCFFIRLNRGLLLLSLVLFGFVVPSFDPWLDSLGNWALCLPRLQPVYRALIEIPFVGLARFYNTMIACGLVAGALCYLPCYALARCAVTAYRTYLYPKIHHATIFFLVRNAPLCKR